MHKNMRYYFTTEEAPVTKTAEEVKKQYETASKKKLSHQEVVEKMVGEFVDVQMEVQCGVERVRTLVNLLAKQALRNEPLSQKDYLNLLIKAEEQKHEPGFQDRIAQLQMALNEAELRDSMMTNSYDPFRDHKEALASSKLPPDDPHWQSLRQRFRCAAQTKFPSK